MGYRCRAAAAAVVDRLESRDMSALRAGTVEALAKSAASMC
jgi:hypothetical protein